jgi:hypothetical protein
MATKFYPCTGREREQLVALHALLKRDQSFQKLYPLLPKPPEARKDCSGR